LFSGQGDDQCVFKDDTLPEGEEEHPLCPTTLLTKKEKARSRKPWKQSLIIKMFDVNLGYL